MARTSIYDINSVGDPAQSWNFDIFFPTIPGSSDTRDLTFKAQSADLPGQGVEIVQVDLHGVKIPFAGAATYGQTFNVTFLETFDWGTREKFRRWREIMRSWRNNSGSFASVYKVNAQIALYDDTPSVVRTIQINGLFPEMIQDVNLDGSQSSAVFVQIQFKYTDTEDF